MPLVHMDISHKQWGKQRIDEFHYEGGLINGTSEGSLVILTAWLGQSLNLVTPLLIISPLRPKMVANIGYFQKTLLFLWQKRMIFLNFNFWIITFRLNH